MVGLFGRLLDERVLGWFRFGLVELTGSLLIIVIHIRACHGSIKIKSDVRTYLWMILREVSLSGKYMYAGHAGSSELDNPLMASRSVSLSVVHRILRFGL
jgi:hypothetical protein